jgi:type IV pilus assembly protein PilN
VILVNLLPHRAAKRQQKKRAFFVALGLAAAAGVAVVGLWWSVLDGMKSAQMARNEFLSSEIRKLDEQIKDIATLRADIAALEARQRAVEGLQADRNTPVHLLNELVAQTPEGVYLTSIKQAGAAVEVRGIAQTNERVSELLRNTLYNSPWLEKPELVEIKAVMIGPNPREQRRLFEFQMKVGLKLPAAAGAASGAASGAAARPVAKAP